jgi:hypothetical protein
MLVLKLDNLVEGSIVKRPSKLVKSPYVADVIINDTEILAHTAALGCCGLCESGASILLAPTGNVSNSNLMGLNPNDQLSGLVCSNTPIDGKN